MAFRKTLPGMLPKASATEEGIQNLIPDGTLAGAATNGTKGILSLGADNTPINDRTLAVTSAGVQSIMARGAYGTCTASENTFLKTVTLPNFILTVGASIIVKFSYGNTASMPVLKVNDTGNYHIRFNNKDFTGAEKYIIANGIYEFVFDGSYWNLLNPSISGFDAATMYGTCDTAVATPAKVITIPNYTKTVGTLVGIVFTNGNTATAPTLNINGTGASPVRSLNDAFTVTDIESGRIHLFQFDGVYYKLLNPRTDRETLQINNVDNTSDRDKPVSTAQREAINGLSGLVKTWDSSTQYDRGNATTLGGSLFVARTASINKNPNDPTLVTTSVPPFQSRISNIDKSYSCYIKTGNKFYTVAHNNSSAGSIRVADKFNYVFETPKIITNVSNSYGVGVTNHQSNIRGESIFFTNSRYMNTANQMIQYTRNPKDTWIMGNLQGTTAMDGYAYASDGSPNSHKYAVIVNGSGDNTKSRVCKNIEDMQNAVWEPVVMPIGEVWVDVKFINDDIAIAISNTNSVNYAIFNDGVWSLGNLPVSESFNSTSGKLVYTPDGVFGFPASRAYVYKWTTDNLTTPIQIPTPSAILNTFQQGMFEENGINYIWFMSGVYIIYAPTTATTVDDWKGSIATGESIYANASAASSHWDGQRIISDTSVTAARAILPTLVTKTNFNPFWTGIPTVPVNTEILTTHGTYIVPSTGWYKITCIGGGAGGNGGGYRAAVTNSGQAGAGGGAGYVVTKSVFLTAGTSVPITIGVGGAGGLANSGGLFGATDGYTTSFGTYVTAAGGKSSSATSATALQQGGIGGGNGGSGHNSTVVPATGNSFGWNGGNGGTNGTAYGGGGGGAGGHATTAAHAGSGGVAGPGGTNGTSGSTGTTTYIGGGNGGAGAIIIEY